METYTALLLISADGRTALCKRPHAGLLAGLWALPNQPQTLGPQEAVALAETFGARPLRLVASAEYTHVFTHVEWRVTCYRIECAAPEGEGQLVWADAAQLADEYALPAAFAKACKALQIGESRL